MEIYPSVNGFPVHWHPAGCAIYGNTVTGSGGGLYLNNSSPVINASIYNNNAGVNGGGIYCYSSSPLITTGGLINANYAGQGGGGMNAAPTLQVFA